MPKKKTAPQTRDTSLLPFVSNYPQLRDWLNRHDARCMWQTPRDRKPADAGYDWEPSAYVESWQIPGASPFIVVVYADHMGWEIYTSGDSVNIDATLADAEARLGIKGRR